MSDPRELCDLADIPIEVEDEQETKHTPEPWRLSDHQSGRDTVAEIPSPGAAIYVNAPQGSEPPAYCSTTENAARIVSCVNACAGINPEAVPDLIAALKAIGKVRRFNDPADAANEAIHLAAAALAKAGVK